MNTISQSITRNAVPNLSKSRISNNKETTEQAKISDAYQPSLTDTVVGTLGSATGAILSAIPSITAGAVNGASETISQRENRSTEGTTERDISELLAGMTVAEISTAVALAGGILAGAPGAIVGVAAGATTGALYTIMLNASGASPKMAGEINSAVDEAVSNNPITSNSTKDTARGFTEGALVGLVSGTKAGAQAGSSQAQGVARGVIEGVREIAEGIEVPALPSTPPSESIGKRMLESVFGHIGGGIGMAFELLDGAILGSVEGATGEGKPADDEDMPLHDGVMLVESAAAAAAAGALVTSGVAVAVAGLAGLIVGLTLLDDSETKDKTGQAKVTAIKQAVAETIDNNPNTGNPVADTFRNATEGILVGAVAGTKVGFHGGYEAGVGVAHGVWDTVAGISQALKDTIG